MTNSVNTNNAAIVALHSLNRTNDQLNTVQKRVTTGFRVNDAVDDGAAFAVAQSIRSDQGGIGAVNSQLTIAKGAVTVFAAAATNISNSLIQARATLTKLADENLTTDQRSKYNEDFLALRDEVQNFITNARFNDQNLLNGSIGSLRVIANADGTQYTIGGGGSYAISADISGAFAGTIGSASSAVTLLQGAFADAENRVGDVLNSLGADSRRIDSQIKFNATLNDALTQALGAIVDADLAKESAALQSLQIRQQLGAQTLGIANQAPQILASLFR